MAGVLRIPFVPLARTVLQRKVIRRTEGFALQPTPADRLGPAYRSGAPYRTTIVPSSDRGERLVLAGRVLSANTAEPLRNVLMEVWQTNRRGLYSDLLGFGLPGAPLRMAFRGRMRTSDDGRYQLETVVPGHYPLGPLSRPRHIHFMITHPGYDPLITQLYFEGDPLLSRDRFATLPLRLSPGPGQDENGLRMQHAHFDFALVEVSRHQR
ncbi:MAG: hypothetical protein WBV82_26405 [Myxococcaceae bacterium]